MRCDWRIAIENALEDVHVPHVHKDSLARLGLRIREMTRYGNNSVAIYDITDKRSLRGLHALSRFFVVSDPGTYYHEFYYPNKCISSVSGFTFSHQTYIPLFNGHTSLVTELHSADMVEGAPELTWFFDNAAKFNKQVFEEDARMCERVHIRGLKGNVSPALRRLAWFTEALNESEFVPGS